MAKIDLHAQSIEELAGLREHATDKLFDKVVAAAPNSRPIWRSSRKYGKPAKKPECRRTRRRRALKPGSPGRKSLGIPSRGGMMGKDEGDAV